MEEVGLSNERFRTKKYKIDENYNYYVYTQFRPSMSSVYMDELQNFVEHVVEETYLIFVRWINYWIPCLVHMRIHSIFKNMKILTLKIDERHAKYDFRHFLVLL